MFFETTGAIIVQTLSFTIYIYKKSVKSFDMTEQDFYGPGCCLYGEAHIRVESETPRESIFADPTLIFA